MLLRLRSTLPSLVLLVAVVVLAAPGVASAGTVSVSTFSCGKYDDQTCFTYAFNALPGEVNHVTEVTAKDGYTSTLRDGGASVSLDPASTRYCRSLDAHTVRCARLIQVSLGDGNDSFSSGVSPRGVPVSGGPGNDTMTGGDGNDTFSGDAGNDHLDGGAGIDTLRGEDGKDLLRGGAGRDALDGGAGNDRLLGDKGNDTLTPGTGTDALDGGPGRDRAFLYVYGGSPVRVDLHQKAAIGPDGPLRLISVEDVTGSDGADVLKGTASANTLRAGSGATVIGRQGNDSLSGGIDGSTLDAGPGDDSLTSFSRDDRLTCGRGNDIVQLLLVVAVGGPVIPADCERVGIFAVGGPMSFTRGRVRGGRLVLSVRLSPDTMHYGMCNKTLTIGEPGGPDFGRVRFTRSGTLSVPLGALGQSAAREHRRVALRVEGNCVFPHATWRMSL